MLFLTISVLFLLGPTFISCDSNSLIAKARIESCPGCRLNKLTDVKQFIYEDIPKYQNVEFKKIQGAIPEMVFLNENDDELERISLVEYNRDQCNDLLLKNGFKIKNKEL